MSGFTRIPVDVGTSDLQGNTSLPGDDNPDAPNIHRPGSFTAEHAEGPLSAAAGRAEAATRETQPNELPSTHLTNMLNKDSVFNQRARKHGEMYANSRGLLNSSIAAGASMGAMMDRIQPYAVGDAQSYLSAAQQNQQAEQQVNLQNAQQETQANISNADRVLSAGQSNQATQTQVYSTEIQAILERGRHDLVWAQTQLDANLRQFETDARLAGIKFESLAQLGNSFALGAATIYAETEDREVAQSKVNALRRSMIDIWNGIGELQIDSGSGILGARSGTDTGGGSTGGGSTGGGGFSGGDTTRNEYQGRIDVAYSKWQSLENINPSGYETMKTKYLENENEDGYTLYDLITTAYDEGDWNTVEEILSGVESDINLYSFSNRAVGKALIGER